MVAVPALWPLNGMYLWRLRDGMLGLKGGKDVRCWEGVAYVISRCKVMYRIKNYDFYMMNR